ARWLSLAVEPARRARREGYVPSAGELRRLGLLGTAALLLLGWWLFGLTLALTMALAGPGLAGWGVGLRSERYSREVEASIPVVSVAIADAMAGGRSVRAAIVVACSSLE